MPNLDQTSWSERSSSGSTDQGSTDDDSEPILRRDQKCFEVAYPVGPCQNVKETDKNEEVVKTNGENEEHVEKTVKNEKIEEKNQSLPIVKNKYVAHQTEFEK